MAIGAGVAPPSSAPMQGLPGGAPMSDAPAGDDMEAPASDQPNVSPEDQALYDKFITNAGEMMYVGEGNDELNPTIIANLRGEFSPEAMSMLQKADPPINPQSPVDQLAATVIVMLLSLEDSAVQAGTDPSDDVILAVGADLLEQIAHVAETAGIATYSEDNINGAATRAMVIYGSTSPYVDQEQLTEEFKQVQAADKAGTLGQLVPGMDEAMQGAQA